MAVDDESRERDGEVDAISAFHARAQEVMEEDRDILDALDE